jgi:hypothetical protein
MIKTPIKTANNSTVIEYPINRNAWKNTFIESGFLVGNYEGNLFKADGATKAFPWEYYEPAQVNYGTLITSLAFFERLDDVEETFFRSDAKTDVLVEKLLARSERLTDEIDLQRQDVRDGLKYVLGKMVAAGIEGYSQQFADSRFNAIIFEPVTLSEIPAYLRPLYSA